MTNVEAGKYSSKHPPGTTYDPAVGAFIEARARGGRLTCADAHDGASLLDVTPAEIGQAADLLDHRIVECQMGLFGYSPVKKIVEPATEIADALRHRLQSAAPDEQISCVACWRIADELQMDKMAVAAGCELLGLKVKECQLGAF